MENIQLFQLCMFEIFHNARSGHLCYIGKCTSETRKPRPFLHAQVSGQFITLVGIVFLYTCYF